MLICKISREPYNTQIDDVEVFELCLTGVYPVHLGRLGTNDRHISLFGFDVSAGWCCGRDGSGTKDNIAHTVITLRFL